HHCNKHQFKPESNATGYQRESQKFHPRNEGDFQPPFGLGGKRSKLRKRLVVATKRFNDMLIPTTSSNFLWRSDQSKSVVADQTVEPSRCLVMNVSSGD
ncbi:hypothetical protein AB1N83_005992, partial [Pleurotus pulmonarius]